MVHVRLLVGRSVIISKKVGELHFLTPISRKREGDGEKGRKKERERDRERGTERERQNEKCDACDVCVFACVNFHQMSNYWQTSLWKSKSLANLANLSLEKHDFAPGKLAGKG